MSSEALKRANGVLDRTYVTRAACEAVANDVLTLLAEVARLEQAHAKMEASYEVDIAALERAEAALAVAREREQPMREAAVEALAFIDALALAVSAVDSREWNPLPVQFRDAVTTLRRGAEDALRAALVDEPAAAEPRAHIDHCVFHPDHEGPCEDDGEWVAAADEPPARRAPPERNPDCVECNEDEFYSQPEWAADGVTPCHRVGTAAIKCPVPAVYVRAAADEPGETP